MPMAILYRIDQMRLLLYNIRYAVGGGASMHMPLPGAGYVLGNQSVLPDITQFIKSVDPDIVGLIEVDTGSIRSRKVNQAEKIAADLGMNTSYETKYGTKSLNKMLPIVRKQGNAFGPCFRFRLGFKPANGTTTRCWLAIVVQRV